MERIMAAKTPNRATDAAISRANHPSRLPQLTFEEYQAITASHERIETVLNRIRPLLQADGVHVELVDVSESGASVRLTGSAVQCPTAPLNFQTGLEQLLRQEIEGFGELRLI
jgi:Fe-S cluster biogenesis protein NfuA